AKKGAPAATKRTSAVKTWHAAEAGKSPPLDEQGRPALALFALNTRERLVLPARGEGGGFAAEDLDRAAHLLRDTRAGNEHPIEPQLLDLVYRIQTHFGAHEIR